MRTARSFFPLLRPFIIKLFNMSILPIYRSGRQNSAPVDETLNNGHLSLLELFFGVATSGVGKVDGMSDLDVIGEGNIFHLNTAATMISMLMLHNFAPGSLLGIPFSEELHFRAKLGNILG